MRIRLSESAGVLVMALLTGCASNPPDPLMSTKGSTIVQTGRVTDIRDTMVRGGHPSGVGSFIGTIVGGVAGSKIGSGTGSTVAGIGGALAGGMTGQRVEEAGKSSSSTDLTVQLDNGESRTYKVDSGESYRVGDPVRITTVNGVSTLAHY
jgi:outer membrane lipoprotein SlyB